MAAAQKPVQLIVDPEALILMSLFMIEDEPRLADILWSWTDVNSAIVSVQRLDNLRPSFPPAVTGRLSGFADLRVDEEKDTRWRPLREKKSAKFEHRDSKTRAAEPRFIRQATLMLQLRLGLGVGVKADVLTYLLGIDRQGSEWASVSRIADALGYTPAAVRRAADDLAKSRFIQPLETGDQGARSQRMFVVRTPAWSGLLGINANNPGWGYWPERYRFVAEVLSWAGRKADGASSAYARDVKARELITAHTMAITQDRIVDPVELAGANFGVEYLGSVATRFANWLENSG
jgi:hypothetical protein